MKILKFISAIVLFVIYISSCSSKNPQETGCPSQTTYHDNGLPKTTICEYTGENIQNSIYTEYYINGNIKEEAYFVDSVEIGWRILYDSLGHVQPLAVMSEYYKKHMFYRWGSNTRIPKKMTFYYNDGQIKEEYQYINDSIKNGFYREFYENGSIKQISHFVKGKELGWQQKYSPAGQLDTILMIRPNYPMGIRSNVGKDTVDIEIKESYQFGEWIFEKNGKLNETSSFFCIIQSDKNDTILLGDTIRFKVKALKRYKEERAMFNFCHSSSEWTKYKVKAHTLYEKEDNPLHIKSLRDTFSFIPTQKGRGEMYGTFEEELTMPDGRTVSYSYFFDYEYYVK